MNQSEETFILLCVYTVHPIILLYTDVIVSSHNGNSKGERSVEPADCIFLLCLAWAWCLHIAFLGLFSCCSLYNANYGGTVSDNGYISYNLFIILGQQMKRALYFFSSVRWFFEAAGYFVCVCICPCFPAALFEFSQLQYCGYQTKQALGLQWRFTLILVTKAYDLHACMCSLQGAPQLLQSNWAVVKQTCVSSSDVWMWDKAVQWAEQIFWTDQ